MVDLIDKICSDIEINDINIDFFLEKYNIIYNNLDELNSIKVDEIVINHTINKLKKINCNNITEYYEIYIKYNNYKEVLSNLFINMINDEKINNLFIENININKCINEMEYYLSEYKLNKVDIKYKIFLKNHINRFENMILEIIKKYYLSLNNDDINEYIKNINYNIEKNIEYFNDININIYETIYNVINEKKGLIMSEYIKKEKNVDNIIELYKKISNDDKCIEILYNTFCSEFKNNVKIVIQLKKKYYNILNKYKLNNKKFEIFLNQYLFDANVINMYFKYINKIYVEGRNTEEIKDIYDIIKYSDNRNAIYKYYLHYYSYRLLFIESNEDICINIFKDILDNNFLNKLYKMKNDISESKGEFKILNSNLWNSFDMNYKIILPNEIEIQFKDFSKKYINEHKNRKLFLIPNLTTCDIITNYTKKKITYKMNIYHYLIINLFNDKDDYTIEEIKKKVILEDFLYIQILNNFCKNKLLIHLNNRYYLNIDLEDKGKKIYLNFNELKKDSYDNIIQSIIVRVMKKYKKLEYDKLIKEVGNFNINEIKKNINILIDKEYIENDMNKSIYTYIP